MTAIKDPFSKLTDTGREAVERGRRDHVFGKGATVIQKGDPVSGAYVVTSGLLRVYTMTPGGKEATLYEIGPGETCVLAINSLFNDLLYPAWVEAEEETGVAVVPGALYRSLFEREPAIQELTVHALSSVVLRLMTELEEVHSHRVDQYPGAQDLQSQSFHRLAPQPAPPSRSWHQLPSRIRTHKVTPRMPRN